MLNNTAFNPSKTFRRAPWNGASLSFNLGLKCAFGVFYKTTKNNMKSNLSCSQD